MKKLFLIAFCLPFIACFAEHGHHHQHNDGHQYTVRQKDYRFSTAFEMDSHGKSEGTVVKSSFRLLKWLRDSYDVYDEVGNWQATGISRIFCLGLIKAWGAEFDVYDPNGNRIGVIDGQVGTTEAAKYSIYNKHNERVAIAYLDHTKAGFEIVHPEKNTLVYARMTRNFVQEQIDHWDVVIYDTQAIDPAIVKVFAAFAVDYQEYFKEDN